MRGVVAAGHPLAAQAGADALRAGGGTALFNQKDLHCTAAGYAVMGSTAAAFLREAGLGR